MAKRSLILGDEEYTVSVNLDLENIVIENSSRNEFITIPIGHFGEFIKTVNGLKVDSMDE